MHKCIAKLGGSHAARVQRHGIKLKARGPGRAPHAAKNFMRPRFCSCVRGAPVAHEVLFLFNYTIVYALPPRGGKSCKFSCRAGRVCPQHCPPVQGPTNQIEKPESVSPPLFFLFSPPFSPLDIFFSIYLTYIHSHLSASTESYSHWYHRVFHPLSSLATQFQLMHLSTQFSTCFTAKSPLFGPLRSH